MTKAAPQTFSAEIARKRRELTRLQQKLGDLLDHLTVIEAREKATDRKRYSTVQVKRALGIRAGGVLQMGAKTSA